MAADEFTTADLVTLIIAAWGAVISTALAGRQIVRDRRRLRIIVLPTYAAGSQGVVELWAVRVVNIRERPIEVRSVGLVLPGGIRQFGSQVELPGGSVAPSPLPALLGDGESVHLYFGLETGLEPHSIEGAFAQDTLGREHVAHYPGRTPHKRWRAWKAEQSWRKRMAAEREQRAG